MKTTTIIVGSMSYEETLNKKISQLESEGYEVTEVKAVQGSGFSKYERKGNIVVVLQKDI